MDYMELERLSMIGKASVMDVHEGLKELEVKGLEDGELISAGEALFNFPTILDDVCVYPQANLYGFDLANYYFGVEGKLKEGTRKRQEKAVRRVRKLCGKFVSGDETSARKIHEAVRREEHSVDEVKGFFAKLKIHDGRKIRKVLEGIGLALGCPEIIPKSAKEAFRSKWYPVKKIHVDYFYGKNDLKKISEDGRRPQLVEGAIFLDYFLKNCL